MGVVSEFCVAGLKDFLKWVYIAYNSYYKK
jgi:hypothetical protein